MEVLLFIYKSLRRMCKVRRESTALIQSGCSDISAYEHESGMALQSRQYCEEKDTVLMPWVLKECVFNVAILPLLARFGVAHEYLAITLACKQLHADSKDARWLWVKLLEDNFLPPHAMRELTQTPLLELFRANLHTGRFGPLYHECAQEYDDMRWSLLVNEFAELHQRAEDYPYHAQALQGVLPMVWIDGSRRLHCALLCAQALFRPSEEALDYFKGEVEATHGMLIIDRKRKMESLLGRMQRGLPRKEIDYKLRKLSRIGRSMIHRLSL
eukprot:TRINITY_DN22700_c0_g1_i1.p1 TRINITY_DN22700_c0_g1~~TRINITY_DN22700_c0_g1_i1.p1  ORF type:complete len:271 (+),score=28.13 TRINITY_DN22700_c0_g1_i1:57-869(+)